MGVEAKTAQMEVQVKRMGNDDLLASSRLLGQGFLAESGAKIVCGELRSRGLAVPHGFELLAVKEGEGDESCGRPPS